MNKIDVNQCDEETKFAAEMFYEQYCANADWLNFRGEPCPMWNALPDSIKSHWCNVALFAEHVALKSARDFVMERLSAMGSRPQMYAITKEAFAAQLLVLAEVALQPVDNDPSGLSPIAALQALLAPITRPTMAVMTEEGSLSRGVVRAEPIDGAWVRKAVALAKNFLEEKCRS